jgi:hypothetical protein
VRIEVKGRSLEFTSPDDYPYETAFLANMASQEQDITQPLIYVLVSMPTKAWVWVCATDRDDTWTVKPRYDSTRKIYVKTLECPRSFLRHADTLSDYVLHHEVLDLIDGCTDAFRGTDTGAAP